MSERILSFKNIRQIFEREYTPSRVRSERNVFVHPLVTREMVAEEFPELWEGYISAITKIGGNMDSIEVVREGQKPLKVEYLNVETPEAIIRISDGNSSLTLSGSQKDRDITLFRRDAKGVNQNDSVALLAARERLLELQQAA